MGLPSPATHGGRLARGRGLIAKPPRSELTPRGQGLLRDPTAVRAGRRGILAAADVAGPLETRRPPHGEKWAQSRLPPEQCERGGRRLPGWRLVLWAVGLLWLPVCTLEWTTAPRRQGARPVTYAFSLLFSDVNLITPPQS